MTRRVTLAVILTLLLVASPSLPLAATDTLSPIGTAEAATPDFTSGSWYKDADTITVNSNSIRANVGEGAVEAVWTEDSGYSPNPAQTTTYKFAVTAESTAKGNGFTGFIRNNNSDFGNSGPAIGVMYKPGNTGMNAYVYDDGTGANEYQLHGMSGGQTYYVTIKLNGDTGNYTISSYSDSGRTNLLGERTGSYRNAYEYRTVAFATEGSENTESTKENIDVTVSGFDISVSGPPDYDTSGASDLSTADYSGSNYYSNPDPYTAHFGSYREGETFSLRSGVTEYSNTSWYGGMDTDDIDPVTVYAGYSTDNSAGTTANIDSGNYSVLVVQRSNSPPGLAVGNGTLGITSAMSASGYAYQRLYYELGFNNEAGVVELTAYHDASKTHVVDSITASYNPTYQPSSFYHVLAKADEGVNEGVRNATFGNYKFNVGGKAVSGTVYNQDGQPVENATVEAWGYKGPTFSDSREELADYANPIPDAFTDQPAMSSGLFGSDGVISTTETGTAPLIYTQDEWPTGFYWGDPDLTNPSFQSVPSDEPVVLTVTDLTKNDIAEGAIDRDIPGQTTDGTIVLQEVDGAGGEIGDPIRVETDSTYNLRSTSSVDLAVFGKDHHYAKVKLRDGIYRVHSEDAEGNKGTVEYYIQVGDPAVVITDTLQNEFDRLSARAEAVDDAMTAGDLVRYSTTTDANGDYTLDVDSSVKAVHVQAYKRPVGMTTSLTETNVSTLRDYYQTTDYNGSFAFSAQPTYAQVPDSDADIRVYELQAPPYADSLKYMNQSEWLLDLFRNQTFQDSVMELMGSTPEDLEKIQSQLLTLKEENAALRDKYETALEDYNNNTLTTEERIRILKEAIRELDGPNIHPEDPTDTEYSDGLVSATIPWSGDLDPDALAVTAHFPGSGTSEPVPDEYVSVNKRVGQTDTVEITDYPVPEDAAMVTFSVSVGGEDGNTVGHGKFPVTNPGFSGQLLKLDSVAVSSLTPGPSETVTITPTEGEESAAISSVDASVDGPSGPITTNPTTSGDGVTFTTDGAGKYYVTLNITDKAGNSWTEGFALKAGDTDYTSPASVRARDGFTGRFALVTDPLTRGSVTTRSGVAKVTAIADSEDVPNTVHFHTEQLSGNYGKTEVRVLKASGSGTPESVRQHVEVYLHTGSISEDAVIYREGRDPIPSRGENGYGSVTCDDATDTCTIHSYTEGDGAATFTVNNDPTIVQSTWHWIRLNSPISLPANPLATLTPDVAGVGGFFGGVPA